MTSKKIKLFLRESNAIENVRDEDSWKQAVFAWEYLIGHKELTVHVILKTHKILMLHQKLLPNEKGYFRTIQVQVGGHEKKPWQRLSELVSHWIFNANDLIHNGKFENPIFLERVVKDHHVSFEDIHPFVDGNGRIGRMLMNWERLKAGLDILVIPESEKQAYYDWFNK